MWLVFGWSYSSNSLSNSPKRGRPIHNEAQLLPLLMDKLESATSASCDDLDRFPELERAKLENSDRLQSSFLNRSAQSCLNDFPNTLYKIKLTQLFRYQTSTSTVRILSTKTVSTALTSGSTPGIRAATEKGPTEIHWIKLSIITRTVMAPDTPPSFPCNCVSLNAVLCRRRQRIIKIIVLQTVRMPTGAANKSTKSMNQLWYSFSYLK